MTMFYLGICFNRNGSFVKAKKLLHDKASKAMYSLIQKGRRLKLPTDIMLKLFESCVAPILLYECEVPVLEISELYSMLKCRWRVTSTRHAVFVITISRMPLLSGHA